jgi:hypothetical protein
MAQIEPLVETSQLKTTLLSELAEKRILQPRLMYDRQFDALIVLFIPTNALRVVHYTDEDAALLYLADSFEIIGIQIEAFAHKFLPAHESVARVWRLSEEGASLHDFADLMTAFENLQPKVLHEVVNAIKDALGEQGAKIAEALA